LLFVIANYGTQAGMIKEKSLRSQAQYGPSKPCETYIVALAVPAAAPFLNWLPFPLTMGKQFV
jgi:hypothetical protein